MNLLAFVLICLTTVLPQVTSQDVEALDRLSCMHKSTQDYIVDRHNELRSTVTPNPANMLKVKWNVEAAKNAEKWAKECKHAHSTPEQREISSCSCGENLYMASRPHEWKKAIQAWYDEVNDFIYGTGPKYDNAVIGHYTQMVYYRTDEIGCAIAYCPNQSLKYYFVCQYCPAGNTNTGIHTPYEAGESCARCINNCENRTCTNACPHHDAFGNCEQMKEMKNECDGHDAVNDEEYYDYSEGSDEGENVKFDMKRDCGAACFCEHEIK